jgi:hypothetical protein
MSWDILEGKKKLLAAIIASLLSFFALRAGMTVEEVLLIVGPLGIYIGGQGLADLGKEAAKVVNGKKS